MKRYRIITNESVYRIQKRCRFGPLHFWKNEKVYEVNDAYPKVVSHWVEFKNLEEAESFVKKRMKEEKPPSRWKVVRKFTDSTA